MKTLNAFIKENEDPDYHEKEYNFHKGQHEYHTRSQGWNLEQNIYNRDWKKDAARAKKKMKFHADALKKLTK